MHISHYRIVYSSILGQILWLCFIFNPPWAPALHNSSTMRVFDRDRENVITNEVYRNGDAMRKHSRNLLIPVAWLSERVATKNLTYGIYYTHFPPCLCTMMKKRWAGSIPEMVNRGRSPGSAVFNELSTTNCFNCAEVSKTTMSTSLL